MQTINASTIWDTFVQVTMSAILSNVLLLTCALVS
ncbi:hypothetical protein ABIE45_005784 [Methylobacterium sp. OAE515]